MTITQIFKNSTQKHIFYKIIKVVHLILMPSSIIFFLSRISMLQAVKKSILKNETCKISMGSIIKRIWETFLKLYENYL